MKIKISSFLIATLMSVGASAAPITLSDTMKEMFSRVQIIKDQLNDTKSNAASAQLAEELQSLGLKAKTFVPKKVSDLPNGNAKDLELVEYKKQIGELTKLLIDLEIQFHLDQNAEASRTFAAIIANMKAGHERFKPKQ